MKKILICLAVGLFLIAGIVPAACGALTAEEIIRRRDDNEYFDSAKVEAEMIIINRNRQIVKTMTSYAQGDNGLVVFTNPRDRGAKFLKRGDDLWMFFPDA
ncbi:MAG: outer membrane lipoprotein-sorting protein, partial [Firmicutes bacterium]|nr:outer membrane lipoprotein-sorting protein [Bacillota bacterium]